MPYFLDILDIANLVPLMIDNHLRCFSSHLHLRIIDFKLLSLLDFFNLPLLLFSDGFLVLPLVLHLRFNLLLLSYLLLLSFYLLNPELILIVCFRHNPVGILFLPISEAVSKMVVLNVKSSTYWIGGNDDPQFGHFLGLYCTSTNLVLVFLI